MAFFKTKKYILLVLAVLIVSSAFYLQAGQFSTKNDHEKIDQIINSEDFFLRLTAEEENWLKTNPPIRLGIDRAFPPFGSITDNKEYIGFTADIMRMLEHRLGLKFSIQKDASWSETMKMAKVGEIDFIAALVNTPQRQEFLNFTPAYIKTPTIIINDGMKNGYIGSLKKLEGKRIAIEKGSYAAEEISQKYPKIELVPVKNTSMALSLVAIGDADAYVGNAVTASYIIKKLAYHNLSFSGETEYSSNHSIGIVKPNRYLHLESVVNKALSSISKDDLDAITTYWFGMRMESFISKELAFAVVSILSGLILFFIFWIYSLSRAKNNLKETQGALQYQSEIDYLTGLGNRRKFYRTLDQMINGKRQKKCSRFSLLFLDLDMFKQVNDSLGHAIGDLLLGFVSKRISDCVLPYNGFVARIGGDEFMLILSGMHKKNDLNKVAECIRSSLCQPFHISEHEILISASIGITRYPEDATSAKQLVINSDQAMYHSKKLGRNCYSYFDRLMFTESQYKVNLIRDLRIAVKEKQFMLYYQPIINLSDNSISKAEALIRWDHPERGFVSPAEFITLAEEAGLINTVGEWIFKKAINDTVTITEKFRDDFQMTVNTSPLQYRKNGMKVDFWFDYMSSRGLKGKNFVVEITEGVLMENSQSVIDNLFQLRDQNIDIAIDDFGTGYSSLSYLKKFDVDFLKIDQSFVKNMTTDPNDIALVQAIIVMAHQLGIKVIAEGIETEAQKRILVKAGCDYGQGYYFSKALDKDSLLAFLEDWGKEKRIDLVTKSC